MRREVLHLTDYQVTVVDTSEVCNVGYTVSQESRRTQAIPKNAGRLNYGSASLLLLVLQAVCIVAGVLSHWEASRDKFVIHYGSRHCSDVSDKKQRPKAMANLPGPSSLRVV